MIQVIPSKERFHFKTDWLSTYWHFSFDQYYDPENVQFGPLRVFNDDVIQPATGFPFHGHKEMEIVTWVLEGELEHRDSMGNTGRIGPGEIQRMSAGTGVRHSEYNASKEKPLHLVQLWILPAEKGLTPSWEQKQFTRKERAGKLLPIAVPVAKTNGGAVKIHQDATIFASSLRPGDKVTHTLAPGRRAYLFVAEGEVQLNGQTLRAGDQARITNEAKLEFAGAAKPGDLLLLDLP